MASSSVSQESLDLEDFELNARKSRIRVLRARACRADSLKEDYSEHRYSGGGDGEEGAADQSPLHVASRVKEKRCGSGGAKQIHLHKGKVTKDKRKLREKRRSAGVIHMASTESTGDSLDEDELTLESQRNLTVGDASKSNAEKPLSPDPHRKAHANKTARSKSPSDLEADLEDNQDYDSTVSQSDAMSSRTSASAEIMQIIGHRPPIWTSAPAKSPVLPPTSSTTEQKDVSTLDDIAVNADDESAPRNELPASPPSSSGTDSGAQQMLSSSVKSASRMEASFEHQQHRQPDELAMEEKVQEVSLTERTQQLTDLLEKERKEKEQLKRLLEEREEHIKDLERQVALLNQAQGH